MRPTLNTTMNVNCEPEHACLRFLFNSSKSIKQPQIPSAPDLLVVYCVSMTALLSVSHLMCGDARWSDCESPSREQPILAQSTNAISCWRSTELKSRPAESKGTCEQIKEAQNTSTDLTICVVGYKQTAHKEQKEPRKEERIRPFSQVRRAAKKTDRKIYSLLRV